MSNAARKLNLKNLRHVGPATLGDFRVLGISSIEALAERDAQELYEELCLRTGVRHDPCAEDVFACAIAQARDPDLPSEQCQWWYWSGIRKKRDAAVASLAPTANRRTRRR